MTQIEDRKLLIAFLSEGGQITKCPARKAKGIKVKRARHDGIATQYRIRTP